MDIKTAKSPRKALKKHSLGDQRPRKAVKYGPQRVSKKHDINKFKYALEGVEIPSKAYNSSVLCFLYTTAKDELEKVVKESDVKKEGTIERYLEKINPNILKVFGAIAEGIARGDSNKDIATFLGLEQEPWRVRQIAALMAGESPLFACVLRRAKEARKESLCEVSLESLREVAVTDNPRHVSARVKASTELLKDCRKSEEFAKQGPRTIINISLAGFVGGVMPQSGTNKEREFLDAKITGLE